MSKDTVFVKGQIIDSLITTNEEGVEIEAEASEIKIGASTNISNLQLKRQKVQLIAEEAYKKIAYIETEEGHAFQSSVIQGVNEADFSTEVASLIFDQPAYFTEDKLK